MLGFQAYPWMYKKWTICGNKPIKTGVTLLCGLMYSNMKHAMNYNVEVIAAEDVPVEVLLCVYLKANNLKTSDALIRDINRTVKTKPGK